MKTIGIVGGLAWPSSITTYRTINHLVEQRAGGGHCARMIFVQTDFADIERMQAAGDWEGVGRQIARSATKLKLAGADFYIVACNTVHTAAAYFVEEVDLPFIHIVDPCGEAIKARGLRTVGLMGTGYTMNGSYFKDRLGEKYGLKVITPEEPFATAIDRALFQELTREIIRDDTREGLKEAMTSLTDRGAEAVILGCTELGLALSQKDCCVPLLDTTVEQAKAAVEFAFAE